METIVVVGAGLAGATAVTQLREQGHEGPIVLFGSEPHVPYERPPLSKAYLLGHDPIEKAFVHPGDWYAAHDVDLRTDTTVTGLHLDGRLVRTDAGDQPYDALLLATGAEPRRLPIADASGASAYLRTIEDSDGIKAAFGPDRRLVIVGAGWIGLEVAAAAREAGTQVTVFESAALPLERVLGPRIARIFADVHRAHDVDLRLDTQVSPDDLRDAPLVVVSIGAVPRTQLAQEAGLAIDNGILVDACLQTSHPGVYAIGDVANQDHPLLGRIRVEHWDTAIEQGKIVAANLLGAQTPYDRMPYFFTDQFDLGMEYVGRPGPDARIHIDGEADDLEHLNFRAYWIEDGLVTAAMHVNDWDASEAIREQLGKPLPDRTPEPSAG